MPALNHRLHSAPPQVAAISLVTAVLVYRFALDPRYPQHHPSVHAGLPSTHLRRSGSGGSGPGRCSGSGDGEPGKAPAAAASPTRRCDERSWRPSS